MSQVNKNEKVGNIVIPNIFISYRRDDTLWETRNIYDDLSDSFGAENVFVDFRDIELGENFPKQIENNLNSCNVLIAVIGKKWLEIKDKEGNRRLENEGDYVVQEISTALMREVLVIPLLMNDASMPTTEQLPFSIDKLSSHNFKRLNKESIDNDIEDLVESISDSLGFEKPIACTVDCDDNNDSKADDEGWLKSVGMLAISSVSIALILSFSFRYLYSEKHFTINVAMLFFIVGIISSVCVKYFRRLFRK